MSRLNLSYRTRKKYLPVLIFTFFFSIYLASSGGHTDPVDGGVYFLIAENIVRNGSPSLTINTTTDEDLGIDAEDIIDKHAWGMAFSKASAQVAREPEEVLEDNQIIERRQIINELLKDVDKENFIGPAYLVLPFLAAPLYAIAVSAKLPAIHFVPLILNSAIIAATALTMFFIGREIYSERIGFVLALIFGISSFIWPYITSMYANPLAVLLIILSIYFILHQKDNIGLKFAFLGGLTIGLAVLAHPLFQIQAAGVLVFGVFHFRKNKKQLVFFFIGLLIMISLQAYLNDMRFGSVIDFGTRLDYEGRAIRNLSVVSSMGFLNTLDSFSGLFFSPGYSIFIYLPIFVLTPIGWYYMYKKNPSLTILMIFLALIMIVFLVTSAQDWNANPHWGPHRYLLGIIPAAIIPIGSLISEFSSIRLKISIIFLSIIGFISNLLGNLVWIQYAYSYGWGPEGLWKFDDIPAIFTWNPYYSPIMQSFKVLSNDWVATLNPNPENVDYFRIGLNGCSFDIYLYCEFGIGAIILLGIIISLVGFYITKILISKESLSETKIPMSK